MKLPTMFVVVASVAVLCSAQPVVTYEPEQPHSSEVLRLKRQAPSMMNNGQCAEGQTKKKGFCIPDEDYAIMPDSGECPEGKIKVDNFCMDEEKYWGMKGEYDFLEPEQPHPSEVLRLKRQAPAIMHDSGDCAKGQIKVNHFCMDEGTYKEMKGEYDDNEQYLHGPREKLENYGGYNDSQEE